MRGTKHLNGAAGTPAYAAAVGKHSKALWPATHAVDVLALVLAKLSLWSDIANSASVSRTWRKAAAQAAPMRKELSLAGARASDARLGRLESYTSLSSLDLCALGISPRARGRRRSLL